ncbi:hypothetical protein C8R44DRAFT_879448 [Mycena epipterygia]|nr:hypothetical protein C8R44DRAFT_879448 [Mycena epipterygia]
MAAASTPLIPRVTPAPVPVTPATTPSLTTPVAAVVAGNASVSQEEELEDDGPHYPRSRPQGNLPSQGARGGKAKARGGEKGAWARGRGIANGRAGGGGDDSGGGSGWWSATKRRDESGGGNGGHACAGSGGEAAKGGGSKEGGGEEGEGAEGGEGTGLLRDGETPTIVLTPPPLAERRTRRPTVMGDGSAPSRVVKGMRAHVANTRRDPNAASEAALLARSAGGDQKRKTREEEPEEEAPRKRGRPKGKKAAT